MSLKDLESIAFAFADSGVVSDKLGYQPGQPCQHLPVDARAVLAHLRRLPQHKLELLGKQLARSRREYGLRFFGEEPCALCAFLAKLTDDGERWLEEK